MLTEPVQTRSSIPVSLDHFVGRTGDFQAALAQLQTGNERWLTITGPGGVGKTRFALELTRRLESRFLDGATWVECADLKTPLEVVRRLLESLGEQVGANPVLQLERLLRDQERLIVLDNLEQIRGMGKLLEGLLGVCASVTVLGTSRSPLRSLFERRYPLLPLECPPFAAQTQAAVILQTEAVQLFLERAGRVEPHFNPPEQEAQILARLCALLDGLPLALELAASQMGNYSLHEILERVQAGRALPTSREQGARQSSLENNLSWGFELLEPSEQALLMRMGLLEGIFQRDLLEAFALGSSECVLETSLETLCEGGWVKRLGTGFRLLETVRVFALGKARDHALEQPTMQALFDFLTSLALDAGAELSSPESSQAIKRLERLSFHLFKVMDWGVLQGLYSQIIGVIDSIQDWLFNRGQLLEVVLLLQRVLPWSNPANPRVEPIVGFDLEPELQVKGYRTLSILLDILGNNQAASYALERAMELTQSSPDLTSYLPKLERDLGNLHFAEFRLQPARACLERALTFSLTSGDTRAELGTRLDLGCVLADLGLHQQAREHLELGLSLLEGAENPFHRAAFLLPLGAVVRQLGEQELGLSLYHQLISLATDLEMPVLVSLGHKNLGLALISHDPGQARIHLLEAIELMRLHHRGFGMVEALLILALLERHQGLFLESRAALIEGIVFADGMDVTVRMILPLEGLAALELALQDAPQAARLLGASRRLLEGISFYRFPEFQEQLEHTEQQLETQLGTDFATYLEQGRAQGHLPLLERYGLQLRYRPAPLSQTLKKAQQSPNQLSPRESEVLKLLAQGFTNKQIAAQLQLSSHTIRGFVVGLFNKLSCKTRAEAVSKASRLGLL